MDKIFFKIKCNNYILFITMLLFKFSCDLGYWIISSQNLITYNKDFNVLKYIVGIILCLILFWSINHESKNTSSFLLYTVFLIQIIPITTIYSLGNDSTPFYITICFSFFICEVIVKYLYRNNQLNRSFKISNLLEKFLFLIMIIAICMVIWRNGVPSLSALNFMNVYDLRKNDPIDVEGNLYYIYTWTIKIIIPFFIVKSILNKKKNLVILLCAIEILMYLYSGHKSILYTVPITVIVTLWSKRKNFYNEFFSIACLGSTAVVLFRCFSPIFRTFWERLYGFSIERILFISANNKFIYCDYFSENPLMGIGGIFPRWLIYIPNYYENIPYTYKISEIYFNKPEMNSNTGFIAEGFMRFGYIGIIFIFIIFAIILIQIDKLQNRTSYCFTVGLFVTPVLFLSDNHLLDSIVFGPWMILILIILFYCSSGESIDKKNNLFIYRIKKKT